MKFILGTPQFGMKYGITNSIRPNFKELNKIKKTIILKKIKFLDTAENYGNSEKIIKQFKLKNINIITKIKVSDRINSINLESYFINKIKQSIRRIGVKKIFCLLLHDVRDAKSKNSISYFKSLKMLKKLGLIKHYGVSVYEPSDIQKILELWTPEFIQIPINILDQRFINYQTLQLLKKKKIKIIARSCFLQGLLLNKKIAHKKFKKYFNSFDVFFKWCEKNNLKYINACLNFYKKFKFIDYFVIGANNNDQLLETLSELNKRFVRIPNKFKVNNKKIIDPRKWKY